MIETLFFLSDINTMGRTSHICHNKEAKQLVMDPSHRCIQHMLQNSGTALHSHLI